MNIYTWLQNIIFRPKINSESSSRVIIRVSYFVENTSISGELQVNIPMETYNNETLNEAILAEASSILGETITQRTEII